MTASDRQVMLVLRRLVMGEFALGCGLCFDLGRDLSIFPCFTIIHDLAAVIAEALEGIELRNQVAPRSLLRPNADSQ